jgi:predicted nucleic acid-binding Zn ribbon protein
VKDARDALHGLLRSLGLEERVRGFKAAEAWPELVGPALAGRSTALDFQDGRLVVEAGSATVMQELAMRRAALLKAFEERFGPGLVREIVLVPAGGSRAPGR